MGGGQKKKPTHPGGLGVLGFDPVDRGPGWGGGAPRKKNIFREKKGA